MGVLLLLRRQLEGDWYLSHVVLYRTTYLFGGTRMQTPPTKIKSSTRKTPCNMRIVGIILLGENYVAGKKFGGNGLVPLQVEDKSGRNQA